MKVVFMLFPYRKSQWLKGKKTLFYTLWIRNAIGGLGVGSSIASPCLLQGGGQKRLTIGERTRIGAHAVIELWNKFGNEQYTPEITIGNECNIGEYCHISAINKITIGNGLLTGRFVYIGDNSHGGLSMEEALLPPEQRTLTSKGPIVIGNNVWIGDKVMILGGVTIGDNVIIGAHSVVTQSVPSNSMWCGIPAKEIKSL